MKIILIILILFIILNIIYPEKFNNTIETFTSDVTKVKFPFRNIYDSNGKRIKIIVIGAYFRTDAHKKQYLELKKKGYDFLGVTSYLEFPGKIHNPYEDKYHKSHKDDYIKMCFAWCHCFKKPYDIFLENTPLALISESDFVNTSYLKPDKKIKKKYDFIYVCLRSQKKCIPGWQEYIHRWDFAKKCIEMMVNKYKLKGILVGRHNCPNLPNIKNSKLIEYSSFLKYGDFIKKIKQSKFLFECAGSTASPRIITESMSLNLPVILNNNIVGGWKYINPNTGELFNNKKDFEVKLVKLLDNFESYKPRRFIREKYGVENSGKRLLKFIKKFKPDIEETKYLKFAV
jgi:glycosyltransferase involved in cell wall biosynthesis